MTRLLPVMGRNRPSVVPAEPRYPRGLRSQLDERAVENTP